MWENVCLFGGFLLENWTQSIIMCILHPQPLLLWLSGNECGFIVWNSFHQHRDPVISLLFRSWLWEQMPNVKDLIEFSISGIFCSFPYVCFFFVIFHPYLCFMSFVRLLDFIKVKSYCVWIAFSSVLRLLRVLTNFSFMFKISYF